MNRPNRCWRALLLIIPLSLWACPDAATDATGDGAAEAVGGDASAPVDTVTPDPGDDTSNLDTGPPDPGDAASDPDGADSDPGDHTPNPDSGPGVDGAGPGDAPTDAASDAETLEQDVAAADVAVDADAVADTVTDVADTVTDLGTGSDGSSGGADTGPDTTADPGDIADAVGDTETPPAAVECFPDKVNTNLVAASIGAGPAADGGLSCDLDGALDMDSASAGLGFSGTAPTLVGDREVTACLVADLGQHCALDSHVGVFLSYAYAGDACGDSGGAQCAVQAQCGSNPGAGIDLFVADSLDDIRYATTVGNCGDAGGWLATLTPLIAFSATADLTQVRYLLACRPWNDCDAGGANLTVDALNLSWRE